MPSIHAETIWQTQISQTVVSQTIVTCVVEKAWDLGLSDDLRDLGLEIFPPHMLRRSEYEWQEVLGITVGFIDLLVRKIVAFVSGLRRMYQYTNEINWIM